MDRLRTRGWAQLTAIAAISLGVTASTADIATAQQAGATAELRDSNGQSIGTATFSQVSGGVQVAGTFRGLPPGEHGIHVHEIGRCDPPDFMSAGGHFNPTGRQHGLQNPQGAHVGDIPNLTVGADGTGSITATFQGAVLGAGPTSFLDADGSALVIHANADDEVTDPTGNSGGRIACGLLTSSAPAQQGPTAKPAGSPVAKPAVAPAQAPAQKPSVQAPAALPRTGGSLPLAEILAGLGGAMAVTGLAFRARRRD